MASRSKRVVEKGFSFKPKGGAATSAATSANAPSAAEAAEAPRLSGSKRRGNTVGFVALDQDEIRDVAVEFTAGHGDGAVSAGSHHLALAVAVGAVKDYTAAVQRRTERQPPYFVDAMGALAEAFECDAPSALASLAARAGVRNPKNIANMRRLTSMKQQLTLYAMRRGGAALISGSRSLDSAPRRYQTELAQWAAASARHGSVDTRGPTGGAAATQGGSSEGGRGGTSRRPPAVRAFAWSSVSAAGPYDAFILPVQRSSEGVNDEESAGGEDAAEAPPFRAAALHTVLQLDRIAGQLERTGAAIDAAAALVRGYSLDRRAELVPSADARPQDLLQRSVMQTATVPLAAAGVGSGPVEPPVQMARTPRRLAPGTLAAVAAAAAAAEASVPEEQRSAALQGRRSGKRAGRGNAPLAATPSSGATGASAGDVVGQGFQESPGEATAGRPSVPDATPKIIGLIRKGKHKD